VTRDKTVTQFSLGFLTGRFGVF